MEKELMPSELQDIYNPKKDQVYMSPDMCRYFKDKLESMRQEILEKEESISHSLVDAPNQEPDPVDQSSTDNLRYNDFMFQEHEDHLRHEIENALQRIKDGTYGYCEVTKQPIGVKRLLLAPMARYCLRIQKKIEAS